MVKKRKSNKYLVCFIELIITAGQHVHGKIQIWHFCHFGFRSGDMAAFTLCFWALKGVIGQCSRMLSTRFLRSSHLLVTCDVRPCHTWYFCQVPVEGSRHRAVSAKPSPSVPQSQESARARPELCWADLLSTGSPCVKPLYATLTIRNLLIPSSSYHLSLEICLLLHRVWG